MATDDDTGQLAAGMEEGWIREDSKDMANHISTFGMANKNAPLCGVRTTGASPLPFYADGDLVLVELISDTARLKDGNPTVDLRYPGDGAPYRPAGMS